MSLLKPFTSQQATRQLERYFGKIQAKSPARPLQVRVCSEKLGLDFCYPPGSMQQPFHVASIGKLFTAVLVYRLAESRALSVNQPLRDFFSAAELERLFVYQGQDYSGQATITHLLGHTSGIADYFEGKTSGGKMLIQDVLAHPETHWTPQMLLDFTRQNQAAVGVPGKVFNYSDTGYILLGLLIEQVSGKSFAQNLEEVIFRPLGMGDSYLMFYGEPLDAPKKPIEKIWFNGVEVSGYESLSCDWAGGGIISTTGELLKFSQALRDGRLVQALALESMDACPNQFQRGIYYGLGMMEIRFGEFFFLLKNLPKVKGHIGILATHLFYDPANQAHIVMNFGDNTRMVESFRALIEIENTLGRVR
jgi:D-alanyl-D-alanine carboxypeptidase